MSKILVEVNVPAAGVSRDVFIPYELRLNEVADLVKTVFADEVSHGFIPSEDTFVCDTDTGAVYNLNLTPEEVGLENGSRLMLL